MGMILSIILNYIFIPIWNIKGAAAANIFAYTLPVLIILGMKSMKEQRIALRLGIFRPLN
jgi:Na+-driven multidrug efflux pump